MNVLSALFLLFSVVSVSYCSNETETRGARIINGATITINAAPYQVSVRLSGNHFCGGSIISRNVILTAAHCKVLKDFKTINHHFWLQALTADQLQLFLSELVRETNSQVVKSLQYGFMLLAQA